MGINDTEFSNTDFNETKLNDTTTTEKQNTSSSSNALKLIKKLENEFNIQVTKSYQKELETIFKPFTDDIIEYAIEYSSNNADYPKKYIKSILEVWKNEGIETLEEAKNFKIKSKTNRNKSMNNREKTPDWLKNKNNKQQIELSENENQHYNEIINKLLKLAHKKYDNDINAYEQLENEIDNMCNTEFNDLEVEEQKLIFDDTEKFINKKLANIEEVVNFKKELIIKWG